MVAVALALAHAIGELMAEQRAIGKLPRGKRKAIGSVGDPPTLKSQHVDKHLADRSRKAAAMPKEKFEAEVRQAKELAVALIEGDKSIISAAKARRHREKKQKRDEREVAVTAKITALPDRRYGVIYADPEWQFEFWTDDGKTNSSAENHYPTTALDDIKKRDVGSIAAPDSVLFLWATVPMLPQALEVMLAWGFDYKSNFAWVKSKSGTGYWTRNKHEHLLIGTKGKVPAPAPGEQWASVIEAATGEHSAKPAQAYEMIEAYFPTLPKIELNARSRRPGWDAWGPEA
jgi:N6-adenosine-specific RNA methylase IME4